MSEGLKPFQEALGGAKLVALIEVVWDQVLVHGPTLQQVIASGENGVCHGNDSALHSARRCQLTKLCRKISILRFRYPAQAASHRACRAQRFPLRVFPAVAFPGALVIARRNFPPRGQVRSRWKLARRDRSQPPVSDVTRCLMPGMLIHACSAFWKGCICNSISASSRAILLWL